MRSTARANFLPRQNTRDRFLRASDLALRQHAPRSPRPDTIPSARGHPPDSQTPRDTPPPPTSPAARHSKTPALLPRPTDPSSAPPATPAAPVAQPILLALSREGSVRRRVVLHSRD